MRGITKRYYSVATDLQQHNHHQHIAIIMIHLFQMIFKMQSCINKGRSYR